MAVVDRSKPPLEEEVDRELVQLLRAMQRQKPVDVIERLRNAVD